MKEDQHYTVSSTNFLSAVGSTWSLRCSHRHHVQKQGRKVRLLPLSGDHSALRRRKNPCSCAYKQIGTHHIRRPSTRNSVWVMSQQGHHKHGVRPQTVPRAEQKTIYRFVNLTHAFDSVSRKGSVDDHGAPWLPPSSSAWLSICTKTSAAKLDWKVTSLDTPTSSTAWNRVVFWHRLCSASFSTWCLNMSQKKLTMTVLYTFATVLTAVCLTSGDCMPTHERLFRDFLFADDAALVTHTERALQRLISCFAEAAQLFRLEVSLKKTEVLYLPVPLKDGGPSPAQDSPVWWILHRPEWQRSAKETF